MSQGDCTTTSKFSPEAARAIAVQLTVARTMRANPAQAIRLIRDNPRFFPGLSDGTLDRLMAEQGVTSEDVERCGSVAVSGPVDPH